jgi:hypothetical protein
MTSATYYSRIAIVFLCIQAVFVWASMHRIPDLGIVPEPASAEELQLLSFGDSQLLFRIMGFRLNNTGDTFGRFSKLSEYNMENIHHWFSKLDALDGRANHLPAMAAYYFSQTQNKPDVIHLVDYLYEHSYHRPQEKWWWLTQAVYMAIHKLKDDTLALKIAKPLEGVKGIPYWAQQMPAFVHEKRGEFEDASIIMQNILKDDPNLTQGELNYIQYFMEDRLKRLKEVEGLLEEQQKRISNETPASSHDATAPQPLSSAPR